MEMNKYIKPIFLPENFFFRLLCRNYILNGIMFPSYMAESRYRYNATVKHLTWYVTWSDYVNRISLKRVSWHNQQWPKPPALFHPCHSDKICSGQEIFLPSPWLLVGIYFLLIIIIISSFVYIYLIFFHDSHDHSHYVFSVYGCPFLMKQAQGISLLLEQMFPSTQG